MTLYEINLNGEKYQVESPDFETAQRDLRAHRQQEMNKQYTQEAETTPEWAKPYLAMGDVARTGVDVLSGGLADKAADYFGGSDEQSMRTAAAKNRMGWAGTGLEASMLAKFLPTAVPKVVAAMKGGPLARTVVGGTTAAAEGGAYGGATAATHGEDVPTGAVVGTGGGLLGHAIGSTVNRIAKAFSPSDIPPVSKIMQVPSGRKPTRTEIVEATVNQARSAASKSDSPLAEQKQLKDAFEALRTSKEGKALTPGQLALTEKIYKGDPATNASRAFGNFLGNKFLAPGVGIGTTATAGPVAGALTTAGLLGSSRLFKGISAGGTEEAVQNLRRTMFKHPKFIGPISESEKANLAKMTREALLQYYGGE